MEPSSAGWRHGTCPTKDEPAHGVDTADKETLGEGNGPAPKPLRRAVPNVHRKPRIVDQRRVLDHVRVILKKVIGTAQRGGGVVYAETKSPAGARIQIIVARVAKNRGTKPR